MADLLTTTSSTDITTITDIATTQSQNPALVYLTRFTTKAGRQTMYQALRTIASLLSPSSPDVFTFPWHQLRHHHTQAVRTLLAERYAPSSANTFLAALRGVLKTAWRMGLMSMEDYYRAADIPAIRGQTPPAGRYVAKGELAAMLDACDDGTPAGVRDAAIISLLYGCGLRRAELVQLAVSDYNHADNTLRVRGKGNKWRIVPVASGAAQALQDWLTIRGETPGPLFCAIRKGGHITNQGITTDTVYDILERRSEMANVRTLSPHDLRRTFVSDLLDAGAEIYTVQRLVGHSQIATTVRYDRRPDAMVRKAMDLIHVPYAPRRVYNVAPTEETKR